MLLVAFQESRMGLIAHYDLTTELATGSDVFEVWMCYITGGAYGVSRVTAEQFVPVLANAVGGYWSSASGGEYEVSFVAGGNITDPAGGCRAGVRAGSGGGSRAALIIEFNSNYPAGGAGNGTAGRWCTDGRNTWWCEDTFLENGRDAVVQAGGGPQAAPPSRVVQHEQFCDHARLRHNQGRDIFFGGDMKVSLMRPAWKVDS